MVKLINKPLLFCLVCMFLMLSCASKKNILYLQGLKEVQNQPIAQSFETKLQPDDVVSIFVSSEDMVGVSVFNRMPITEGGVAGGQMMMLEGVSYLIYTDGTIEFPGIGNVHLAGKTLIEARDYLKEQLKPFIKKPIVTIKWVNNRFSVLGEVKSPGIFPMDSQRVTILEALAMAGDLSILGKRKDIMLIRENNQQRTTFTVDLTSQDLVNEDYYFVQKNDVIIVNPNNPRVQASAIGPNIPLYLSIASFVLTTTLILTR